MQQLEKEHPWINQQKQLFGTRGTLFDFEQFKESDLKRQ